ncbi:MAG TPA: LEPR-XLL domain-containing protein, partial [Tepidisphaeraceae bacterium]|nr:LEPR-XLL domain-containing protein [Tepidisphaeraceae bacterium]
MKLVLGSGNFGGHARRSARRRRNSRLARCIESAVETLENRLLLSGNTYLISIVTTPSTHTVYTVNGGSATTLNSGDTITGTSSADSFTISGSTVNFTIDTN